METDLKTKELESRMENDNVPNRNIDVKTLLQFHQLFNRQDQRFANSLNENFNPNTWSLLISKLVGRNFMIHIIFKVEMIKKRQLNLF